MNLTNPQTDRAVGAVLASAAGDAMGAPYEFGEPNPTAPCELEGGGGFRWAPGEWTDDTQMALAVLTTLADGSTDVAEMGQAMVDWYESGPRDVGNQTRAVLGAASRSRNGAAEAAAAYQRTNPDSAGNGALMRTGPVALGHLGDREAVAGLAAEVSALTHPHADSVDACVLWSLAIEKAITTANPDADFDWYGAILDGLEFLDTNRRDTWRERLDEARDRHPVDYHSNNGWVVAAFQAAFAAINSTPVTSEGQACEHLADALRLASRSGGDTDTVAAIAGSLLGARWGATAIPLVWRRILNGRRTYDKPRLRASHLENMARLAVRGGKSDSAGWPSIKRMVPYYVEKYGSRSLVQEVGGVWFGNAAGLSQALDDGAKAVVSLCRMGTADVPEGIEHITVGVIDTKPEDNPNLDFMLADTAGTIAVLADEGKRVFVHCVAAQNRTPVMAAAYLMVRGVDPVAALKQAAQAVGRYPQPFLADALLSPGFTVE